MALNPKLPKVIGGTEIVFCEDTRYKTQIWTQHCLEKVLNERLRLYKVILADESVVFCLAESETGAIGQSTCRAGEPKQSYEQKKSLEDGAKAILVENFKIRGWGSANFNQE